jgi:hypothetical protein
MCLLLMCLSSGAMPMPAMSAVQSQNKLLRMALVDGIHSGFVLLNLVPVG